MIEVVLIRHAIAADRDPARWPEDHERPLTAEGRRRFRAVARTLARVAPRVDLVLSSPLRRAWQTAEILHTTAGWPKPTPCEELGEPFGEEALWKRLRRARDISSVVLVGHEPTLSLFSAALLLGAEGAPHFGFKKGGAACIRFGGEVAPGLGELRWLLPPRVARASGGPTP